MILGPSLAPMTNNPLNLVRAAISSRTRARPRPLWFGKSTQRFAVVIRTEVRLQSGHVVHVVVSGVADVHLKGPVTSPPLDPDRPCNSAENSSVETSS